MFLFFLTETLFVGTRRWRGGEGWGVVPFAGFEEMMMTSLSRWVWGGLSVKVGAEWGLTCLCGRVNMAGAFRMRFHGREV